MAYGNFGGGGQRRWKALGAHEANDHIGRLIASGLSVYAYAQQNGVQRNALAEAIREFRPDIADTLLKAKADASGSGTKFEYSAKQMLERRGYFVMRQYASKSPVDLLAVGQDKPVLFVQVKKTGNLPFSEWNALWDLAVEHGGWPVLVQRPPGESRGALWFRLTDRKAKKGLRSAQFLDPFEPRDVRQTSLFAPSAAA